LAVTSDVIHSASPTIAFDATPPISRDDHVDVSTGNVEGGVPPPHAASLGWRRGALFGGSAPSVIPAYEPGSTHGFQLALE
jgi:hypothetical protein